ncbi:MAG TPA: anhydro-N-acetylmuramic acid kinase [Sulfuricaulis sp.]|nr:anhydro-N-acetylmuramic acid kinase [Sulfuricaulis sp.]
MLPETAPMHYIGLMSGTSADGIDAALINLSLGSRPVLVATHAYPLEAAIRGEIQALMRDGLNEVERLGELDIVLGEMFAAAANGVLRKSGLARKDIRAIGSHGQTLRHRPRAAYPFSLQIGNPSVIAERTGITTVADFRARDMAAGGQGAPLVSAFHHRMFHSPQRHRVIINIGGIANVTSLPSDVAQPVSGFDTGPGNTLLDQWINQHQARAYDEAGQWAASGRASTDLLRGFLSDPYFEAQPPKSTGREHFNLNWLQDHLKRLTAPPSASDVQATLVQLTTQTIARAIRQYLPQAQEAYVCGGGAHNRELMLALTASLSGITVTTTETLGLAPDWVESSAFAWLAHQAMEREPGNIPSVTGARRAVVLGGIYPA